MNGKTPRRAANACQRCRARKVRCSGMHPCDKCQQRRLECHFQEDKKIAVSEELFLSMKRKLDEFQRQSSPASAKRLRASEQSSESAAHSRPSETRFESNLLVAPRYLKNTGRQRAWLCLGPTSTWSFSRRVLSIIRDRLNPDNTSPIPLAVDGDAYQLHWDQARANDPPDLSGLPSLEYAIYMLKTVQFHLNPLWHLIDEDEFVRNLHEFYSNAPVKAIEARIWYVQFLVVLAFGEAILTPVRTGTNLSSWTRFFTRAMALLPDITALWHDPILAVELLALVALYFHSIDLRDSAYCYIGHAMRIALVEGFHRALPVEQLGERHVERCNKIWWTVYILDRKFSALIGAPNAVNDEDMTATPWDIRICSQEAAAVSLHVKISQVISRALNTVYAVDGKLGGIFLGRVRSVLHEMTGFTRQLEEVFAHRFHSSVETLSGVATRLKLACHQCIIVTVRPLVLSLLWERLACFNDDETLGQLSSPVRTLIHACVESATKSLRLLIALREHNILESFLPFDLENAFSASFILTLVAAILPAALPDQTYRDMGFSVLDEMIARGSRVAQLRKSEIELLEDLARPLRQAQEQPPAHGEGAQQQQHLHLATPLRSSSNPSPFVEMLDHPVPSSANSVPDEEMLFDWRYFGLSLNQMLSAANELNASTTGDELQDLWLWSDQ
ncbi:hypothetical protein ASPZODRAFT_149702 [Penicilliopsis zonata CBS 506.65]|uniref:Zn(2)-C6 fungal-type domain-containing protein n=1 Tax=Penicilliopsis zonata CBS 506.65 TaxID=1073090 RepID=A0A1L9ST35_9EURO|nr:hypothetical protein ASPZODRAFT_149702 [Penicilliopsis zonata CBS 506.65]OJJ50360.1 hypothetical protein ASPZODRAFT_149702 [Penicilliopsis zonata CBS 506.65]